MPTPCLFYLRPESFHVTVALQQLLTIALNASASLFVMFSCSCIFSHICGRFTQRHVSSVVVCSTVGADRNIRLATAALCLNLCCCFLQTCSFVKICVFYPFDLSYHRLSCSLSVNIHHLSNLGLPHLFDSVSSLTLLSLENMFFLYITKLLFLVCCFKRMNHPSTSLLLF